MILLKKPATVPFDVKLDGKTNTVASRKTILNVSIMCLDADDDKSLMWNKLKYGPVPDLADAMLQWTKIKTIEFPTDNIILHGVFPVKMESSSIFSGRVFECIVDSYEVTQ